MSIGFNYHNSLKVPTSRFSIFNTSQHKAWKVINKWQIFIQCTLKRKVRLDKFKSLSIYETFNSKLNVLVQVSMTMILEFKFLSYTTIPPLQTVTYNSKNGIDRWSKRWKERGMNKTHYTAQFSWRKHTITSLKILSLEQYNELNQ